MHLNLPQSKEEIAEYIVDRLDVGSRTMEPAEKTVETFELKGIDKLGDDYGTIERIEITTETSDNGAVAVTARIGDNLAFDPSYTYRDTIDIQVTDNGMSGVTEDIESSINEWADDAIEAGYIGGIPDIENWDVDNPNSWGDDFASFTRTEIVTEDYHERSWGLISREESHAEPQEGDIIESDGRLYQIEDFYPDCEVYEYVDRYDTGEVIAVHEVDIDGNQITGTLLLEIQDAPPSEKYADRVIGSLNDEFAIYPKYNNNLEMAEIITGRIADHVYGNDEKQGVDRIAIHGEEGDKILVIKYRSEDDVTVYLEHETGLREYIDICEDDGVLSVVKDDPDNDIGQSGLIDFISNSFGVDEIEVVETAGHADYKDTDRIDIESKISDAMSDIKFDLDNEDDIERDPMIDDVEGKTDNDNEDIDKDTDGSYDRIEIDPDSTDKDEWTSDDVEYDPID